MWRWDQVQKWINGRGYTAGCEVGVKEGRFIRHMLETNPDMTMIAVDPWEDQPDGNETYNEWDWKDIYREYKKRIKPYKKRVTEYRMYSVEAAKLVKDKSLDFVFLDAQHDYESIKEDIRVWMPKVREGGLICGHDHDHKFPGVVRAVKERFPRYAVGSNAVWGKYV